MFGANVIKNQIYTPFHREMNIEFNNLSLSIFNNRIGRSIDVDLLLIITLIDLHE